MKSLVSTLAASALASALFGAAVAQDHSMQGHDMGNMGDMAGMELPAACRTGEAPAMPDMEDMQSAMETMNETQQAFMEGMMEIHGPMMQGMMAEDPDLAFACGMIPHHQGAINMARVELERGDSDEMKELAQKIIEDQTREIEQLTQWIEQQAQ